ncbi:ATP-binding protein [Nibrella viscosa]
MVNGVERLLTPALLEAIQYFPAVSLVGPRQVGKTTLAHHLAAGLPKPTLYLDLERTEDQARLGDRPAWLLEQYTDHTVVLDEIQRMPQLFPQLRALIDDHRVPGRFILLGSASPDLLAQSGETLAGRICFLELTPFLRTEVADTPYQTHWFRGGFPEPFLMDSDRIRTQWYRSFIQSYVERDLPLLGKLGVSVTASLLSRLLRMLTTIQGALLNYSMLAGSLGVSVTTVRNYIDLLEEAFIVRRLEPYFVNIGKRLTKSPKFYLRDSGLLHHLLNLASPDALLLHAQVGASWEGYVIEQIINQLADNVTPYFYRTQQGAELDLVLVRGNAPILAVEVKLSNSPTLSRGVTIAQEDMGGVPLLVVTPSAGDYPFRPGIRVVDINTIWPRLAAEGLLRTAPN